MYFKEIIKDLRNKKERREQGQFNGIPTPFQRYSQYFPSIDKGHSIGILGSTGIGKSKLIRELAVYNPINFHLKTGYSVKILYFALEDPKASVYKKIITRYFWEKHNILLPAKYLESKDEPLSDAHLTLLEKDEQFYEALEKMLFIVNDASTPSSIKDVCYKFHDKYGKDNHLIVVIDNYSNIVKEQKHNSDWDAIKELSREIIRLDLCRDKQMTVFNVLQVDFESEKNAFRNASKGTIASVEPNMGSIGDAKVIARDQYYLFALFNPWRYEIPEYMGSPNTDGYRIDILRNRFRSLLHLKSNEGEIAPRLGLYFEGLQEKFIEMPSVADKASLEELYRKIDQEEKEKRERFLGKTQLF